MNALDRFLKYVTFDTTANEASTTVPSTASQRTFALELVKELENIGLEDITLDDKCYLMATLPSNSNKSNVPNIGFIAHLDTSPDMSGANIKPRIVSYDGGDITLNNSEQIILSPTQFPELNYYIGQSLVVTDGQTLLGADDKAGVAAIISAMAYLKANPSIAHGTIRIGFTPDEEIGRGADFFDVDKFNCEYAYTIDGGQIGELEYENFNAAGAKITFKGLNVHPGYAKDKMVNASLLANKFIEGLPANERPETTVDYEGFYHLTAMTGTVEKATLNYIIRDHSREQFEAKKQYLIALVSQMNQLYPESTTLELNDQYYNMREMVEPKKHIIDIAYEAMEAIGVKPLVKPIRGGTDGSRLSFMGLPCPNIFAGGHNFHGRYEFLPIESLQKSMETIVKIASLVEAKI
jgi:tripeptide aminopeptidase